jgi:mannose-1-phosphate guanylyltransferase
VEAILLVGGKGNRLRPLTVTTPKPMLPVAGVPFIAHQLAQAKSAGVDRVVLATSYKSQVFTDWLGDGARLGIQVEYVVEQTPLGTGGAMRNAADRLLSKPDDPVVVFNGDVLSGHDLVAQLEQHRNDDADVTLHLTEVDDPRAFGCVPIDQQGRVTAFLEKMPEPVTNRINAGCYVFRRSIIDTIPFGEIVSVERQTFPELLASGARVRGFVDTAYWLDVGSPQAIVSGSRDLVLGRVPSPALPGVPGERLVLPGSRLDAAATVRGGSAVGTDVTVHRGAVVDGSVVDDGAVIEADAVVRDSFVGAGARIGPRTVIDGAVVGDRAHIGADCEVAPGTRVWVDAVLGDLSIRTSSDQA